MGYRAIWIALLLSTALVAGCGTVTNLYRPGPEEGGKVPFGGVRHDVSSIKKATTGELSLGAPHEPESRPQVALMLLCAADLPLSIIGDVVTWPYTAAYSWANQSDPVPPVVQAPGVIPPQGSP